MGISYIQRHWSRIESDCTFRHVVESWGGGWTEGWALTRQWKLVLEFFQHLEVLKQMQKQVCELWNWFALDCLCPTLIAFNGLSVPSVIGSLDCLDRRPMGLVHWTVCKIRDWFTGLCGTNLLWLVQWIVCNTLWLVQWIVCALCDWFTGLSVPFVIWVHCTVLYCHNFVTASTGIEQRWTVWPSLKWSNWCWCYDTHKETIL